jgi:hypothetical protein
MDVIKRLQEHLDFAKDEVPGKIVGIFFYGSENYNLHTEESDVDAKILFIPDDGMGSTIVESRIYHDHELLSFVDIRFFLFHLCDGDLAMLEMLYSKYSIIMPEYQTFWNQLLTRRSNIAASNLEGLFFYVQQRARWVLLNFTSQKGEKISRFNPLTNQMEVFWSKGVLRMVQLEQIINNAINQRWQDLLICERLPKVIEAKKGQLSKQECYDIIKESYKRINVMIYQYQMFHKLEVDGQTVGRLMPIIDDFLSKHYSREEISNYMELESQEKTKKGYL